MGSRQRAVVVAVAVVTSTLLLAGCGRLGGTGSSADRWAGARAELMSKERAWREFPTGATQVGSMPSLSFDDGPPGFSKVRSVGGELKLSVPRSVDRDEITDFYVALFAAQGHANIRVGCRPDPRNLSRSVSAVRWTGEYGYTLRVATYVDPGVGVAREPRPLDPYTVRLMVTGNRKMAPSTPEDPVNLCFDYPLDRMAGVLEPFGMVPFRADVDTFQVVHDPLGEATERKTPPRTTVPRRTGS